MPSTTLRDEHLGSISLRLVRRANGTLAGRYAPANGDTDIVDAEPDETADELWLRLRAAALQADRAFVGFEGAIARFLAIFPGRFDDVGYLERQRNDKVDARELLNSSVPLNAAATGTGFADAVLAVYRKTRIIDPRREVPRVADALRSRDGDHLIRHVARFALGDRSQLATIARIAKQRRRDVADRHLPALPVGHRGAARRPPPRPRDHVRQQRRPREFPHVCNAQLVPAVYASLLDLFATTANAIWELRRSDVIDVQSFIRVVGKYGE